MHWLRLIFLFSIRLTAIPAMLAKSLERLEIGKMQVRSLRHRWIELSAPLFLLSLMALLLNDFWWKSAFHNDLTGKISDFAGLYAFAWVGLTLVRSQKWLMMLGIALFFVWFKSDLSAGFLSFWNATVPYQLERVVDFSDCWAILVLPLAVLNFQRYEQDFRFQIKPVFRLGILGLSLFAFVATSESNTHVYQKSYAIDASASEVVQKLNSLPRHAGAENPSISLLHENANEFVDQGNIRLFYHHSQTQITEYDTVYGKIEDSIFIDEIHPYTTPAIDTVYVSPDGYFKLQFAVLANNSDSILCKSIPTILKLEEKGSKCELTLVQITVENCPGLGSDEKGGREGFLREKFEEYFIQALK